MLYFDTSFLAPLFQEEATSARIEGFMQSLPPRTLTVSHWTKVEFSSLLAREVRMGNLTVTAATRTNAEFDAIMEEAFVVLLPDADDFRLAREYLGQHKTGLRAGDALHLAIAGNRRMEAIFSLDKALLKAGSVLGLPVSLGI
jgi:predicted nucleic acid-binding protein